MLLDAIRPAILNGIEEVVNRPDLADRAIFLTLEPIPDDKRRLEAELWAAFEAVRPRILGALLDAVAVGLERLPEIRLKKLPRMADFAIWATACETALRHQDGTSWEDGTFMKAYGGNIDEAVESVLDANLVATAVRTLMANQTSGPGPPRTCWTCLAASRGRKPPKPRPGPPMPRGSAASCAGPRPSCARSASRSTSANGKDMHGPAPSPSPAFRSKKGKGITASAASARPNGDADARAVQRRQRSAPVSTTNPLKNKDKTAADAADAELPYPWAFRKRRYARLSEGRIRELADDCPGRGRHGTRGDR